MAPIESKLSVLKLVFPPMSNQEAVWWAKDESVAAVLKQSDFYMIVGRTEAKFLNFIFDRSKESVSFDFALGDEFKDHVAISFRQLPAVLDAQGADLEIESGEKFIRIWKVNDSGARSEVLDWFTTEKLLYDVSQNKSGLVGLERYREAYKYDLLYVGIATVGDSFQRLIAKGHKTRTEILANEPQRLPGARVTDETFLLLFRIDPIVFKQFDPDEDFEEVDLDAMVELKRVVSDAEKAFVRLLDPKYNTVKYQNYPRGADGLFSSRLVRYAYSLGENLTLVTANSLFKGGWDALKQIPSNEGDCIFVEGKDVVLLSSGIHFGLEARSSS